MVAPKKCALVSGLHDDTHASKVAICASPTVGPGVCDSAAGIAKLAEAVYRGVLHALPASARAWFGDLRDRGLSAAVEVRLPAYPASLSVHICSVGLLHCLIQAARIHELPCNTCLSTVLP